MSICVHVCSLQHLHCTSMVTTLVTGVPTPLSAVHLYCVASRLLMLINGMVTTLLSKSLVHVMVGVGLPSAKHFSVTLLPSVTVLPAISVIRGLTESQQGNGKGSFHQKHNIYILNGYPLLNNTLSYYCRQFRQITSFLG